MTRRIFKNGKVVLRNSVSEATVTVEQGVIAGIHSEAPSDRETIDLEGDLLIPGLIDLHSDHLEKHIAPRTGVYWHPLSAALSYDAQIISAGITTIFDSFGLVGEEFDIDRGAALDRMVNGVREASQRGLLRAQHFTHLRCEVIEPDIVDRFARFPFLSAVKLVSLMDHTPGQRTFMDVNKWREHQKKRTGSSDEKLESIYEARRKSHERYSQENRRLIAKSCCESGIVMASHDDTTAEHVAEAAELGNLISEFPTTMTAANEARKHGMSILMGSPNLVRGGSHIGNLSAGECAKADMLDILASDYIPASLLLGAMVLTRDPICWALPRAIATVTSTPAERCGLSDRGEIAPGRRADLVRVSLVGDVPVVRSVWSAGEMVF